jgi:hypothetical protein
MLLHQILLLGEVWLELWNIRLIKMMWRTTPVDNILRRTLRPPYKLLLHNGSIKTFALLIDHLLPLRVLVHFTPFVVTHRLVYFLLMKIILHVLCLEHVFIFFEKLGYHFLVFIHSIFIVFKLFWLFVLMLWLLNFISNIWLRPVVFLVWVWWLGWLILRKLIHILLWYFRLLLIFVCDFATKFLHLELS